MTKRKGILNVVERVLKNDTPNDSNTENGATAVDNSKINMAWKIVILVVLAVGVALGCCDVDCLLLNIRTLFGL